MLRGHFGSRRSSRSSKDLFLPISSEEAWVAFARAMAGWGQDYTWGQQQGDQPYAGYPKQPRGHWGGQNQRDRRERRGRRDRDIAFRLLLTTLMRSDCPSTLSRSLLVKTTIARPRSLWSTPEMRGSCRLFRRGWCERS